MSSYARSIFIYGVNTMMKTLYAGLAVQSPITCDTGCTSLMNWSLQCSKVQGVPRNMTIGIYFKMSSSMIF